MEPQLPVRLLLVEDSEEDALRLSAHLQAEGLACDLSRVKDLASLQEALTKHTWDILVTDSELPALDGPSVIREAQRLVPGLPCIVLADQVDEEATVEAFRAGAKDVVRKARLARLLPAIQRELTECQMRAGAEEARAELRVTEEALRQTESLFSSIHRHVVDLIAIIDSEGHRLYTSPSYQFVLGYSEAEMAAHSLTALLHPEDAPRVSGALRDLMQGEPTQGLEYRLRHKDGRWLHFESTAAIIPSADRGNLRALVVARNITERKEAEQQRLALEVQLRQGQKLEAIGRLAAGIAHEINTPTQYIGDNATFLRESCGEAFALMGRLMASLVEIRALGGPGAEVAGKALDDLAGADMDYLGTEIPKAIQQSIEGVGRISEIVSAMKDFSHPGSESKVLADLHRAIESTITVSRNEWKYSANLVMEFDPDLPLVPCYPGELNQVILNLIVNAAHAIEAARGGRDSGIMGHIVVMTRTFPDAVEISVSDDGTGIPEEVQAHMFEPFYTTKPLGKGTGQGLAIVHSVIVEKHRGSIEVQSAVGRGTTIILRLPMGEADGAAGSTQ